MSLFSIFACNQNKLYLPQRVAHHKSQAAIFNDPALAAQLKDGSLLYALSHVLSCATMSNSAAGKQALERRQHGASPKGWAYAPAEVAPSAHTPAKDEPPCQCYSICKLQKGAAAPARSYGHLMPILPSAWVKEEFPGIPEG